MAVFRDFFSRPRSSRAGQVIDGGEGGKRPERVATARASMQ